jgi:hypothetical protein
MYIFIYTLLSACVFVCVQVREDTLKQQMMFKDVKEGKRELIPGSPVYDSSKHKKSGKKGKTEKKGGKKGVSRTARGKKTHTQGSKSADIDKVCVNVCLF